MRMGSWCRPAEPEPEPEPEPTVRSGRRPTDRRRPSGPRSPASRSATMVFSDVNRSGDPGPAANRPQPRISVQLLDADGDVAALDASHSASGTTSSTTCGPARTRCGSPASGPVIGCRRARSATIARPIPTPTTPASPRPSPSVGREAMSGRPPRPTTSRRLHQPDHRRRRRPAAIRGDRPGLARRERRRDPADRRAAGVGHRRCWSTPTTTWSATSPTDAQGSYSFTDLPAGNYRIRFEGLPANRAFTLRGRRVGPHRGFRRRPVDRRTPEFKLEPGRARLSPAADAGVPGRRLREPDDRGRSGRLLLDRRHRVARRQRGRRPRRRRRPACPASPSSCSPSTVQPDRPDGHLGQRPLHLLRTAGRQLSGQVHRLAAGLRFTAQQVGNNPAVDSDAGPDGITPVFSRRATTIRPTPRSTPASPRRPTTRAEPVGGRRFGDAGRTPRCPRPAASISPSRSAARDWCWAGRGCLIIERRRARLRSSPTSR